MLNIEQFIIKNKIEYRTSGKNVSRGEYSICCPFCEEGGYHLGINPIKKLWHCWICGARGDILKLVSKLLNISYIEAKQIINPQNDLKKVLEERNNKMVKIEEKVMKNKEFELPPHTYSFRQNKTNLWEETALKFLRDKYDLSKKEIIEADLHYCVHGKYKNCIIIPIYQNNKLVNFVGRTWDKNSKKRYINSSNEESLVKTKSLLYNYDSMKIGQNLIVVVEGVFDCIKVGLNRATATLGSEISQEQINLLVGLKPKKLIVLADNDPGNPNTVKKAQKICDYLSPFMNTKMIEIPYMGKDPADLTKEEIINLLGGVTK